MFSRLYRFYYVDGSTIDWAYITTEAATSNAVTDITCVKVERLAYTDYDNGEHYDTKVVFKRHVK